MPARIDSVGQHETALSRGHQGRQRRPDPEWLAAVAL